MAKKFNVTGLCLPEYHYMVDISDKIDEIRTYIDDGEYFAMNRARQYGKTTTLKILKDRIQADYVVFSPEFDTLSFHECPVTLMVTGIFLSIFYIFCMCCLVLFPCLCYTMYSIGGMTKCI